MTFTARQRLLRLWTALLCLVASFAYLTREPDNLSGALGLPTLAGMDMGGEMADMNMNQADHSAHDQPSAPNNPAHKHAAHCPFCFSAAFALEAQGFVLALAEAARPAFLRSPYLQPHLLEVRHAEARAPPTVQTEA